MMHEFIREIRRQARQQIKHHVFSLELATVTTVSPLMIQVDGMKTPLTESELLFTKTASQISMTPGKRLVVCGINGGQQYLILDELA